MYHTQIDRRGRPYASVMAIFAIAICPPVQAARDTPASVIASPNGVTIVPITFQHGHLYVTASVNGKPAVFVIDSGAGANVLDPDAAQHLGISADAGEHPIMAHGVGGNATAQGAVIGHLQVGDAFIDDSAVYLVSLPAAIRCDGLLGYDFLRRFVTTIDWTNKTLTLRNPSSISTGNPPGTTLPITLIGNVPSIQVNLDGHSGSFGLDTGYDGSVVVNTPFVEKNHLIAQYPNRLETVMGIGIGGVMHGETVRVKTISFGDITLNGVLTSLSNQQDGTFADKISAGIFGAEMLSRFTITLDYAKRCVTLEKNALFDKPFIFTRTGIGILDDPKSFKIMSVMPHSPGEEAGVLVGDRLLAVNDTPVEKLPPDALWNILHDTPGTKVRLRLQSGENAPPHEVTLTLRDIL